MLSRLIAAEFGDDRRGVLRLRHVQRVGRRLLHPSSQAAGFLSPVPTSAALIARTEAALVRVERALDAHIEHGMRDLHDIDLETGLPITPAMTQVDRAAAAA